MKRVFLFIAIATLISAGGICGSTTPASATIGQPETFHWTLDELIGALDGTNTEIWSRPECQMQDTGDEDPMMGGGMLESVCDQMVRMFAQRDVIITAINPSKSTVKVYFRDNSLYGGTPATYADFYLFWHESYLAALQVLYNGVSPEGTYDLLRIRSDDLSTGILQPNKEIELTITENQDKLADPSYQIHYAIREDDYAINTAGTVMFGSCFEEGSGYQDGMECQIRFDEYLNYVYVPVAVDTATGGEQPEETPTTTEGEDNGNASIGTTENTTDEGYGNVEIISTSRVKTPETGANSKIESNNDSATEFPWWLGLIFCLGALVLAWLFWPKRTNKN